MIITPVTANYRRGAARLAAAAAIALAVSAGWAPTAWAQPIPDDSVEAICVAQTTEVPNLIGGGATAQDTITCTDAAGIPLISGRSDLTIDGSSCGDSTTTITTRWDDGTRTVTETTGHISPDDRKHVATGTVTSDSTRFADATVSVAGTGVEPSCDNPFQPAAAVYIVTFHH
ncbi:hypothetical protein BOX37_17305 [Nocardia mangyaensis]|uniref:DUF3558 domain-containing protein n=1 Tax=Nocardia mangyaensis TaxID=2213200 RepID=A0A1J0VTP3_9NOCA|nr:hypothetical protein [Nocardia mangyaensis]APE35413.1 hypothetical protein BOX37_17305 [Nocardia mangyaensis]